VELGERVWGAGLKIWEPDYPDNSSSLIRSSGAAANWGLERLKTEGIGGLEGS
jgi:hypothetical protein